MEMRFVKLSMQAVEAAMDERRKSAAGLEAFAEPEPPTSSSLSSEDTDDVILAARRSTAATRDAARSEDTDDVLQREGVVWVGQRLRDGGLRREHPAHLSSQ
uniref:Uncharacterized protein n=2 Tax=Zea mays TaxID=4577 RepID=C0P502_MAIZE|nr:unknown [Zea mays]ACR36936.1 unknown [Zea mays]